MKLAFFWWRGRLQLFEIWFEKKLDLDHIRLIAYMRRILFFKRFSLNKQKTHTIQILLIRHLVNDSWSVHHFASKQQHTSLRIAQKPYTNTRIIRWKEFPRWSWWIRVTVSCKSRMRKREMMVGTRYST